MLVISVNSTPYQIVLACMCMCDVMPMAFNFISNFKMILFRPNIFLDQRGGTSPIVL